MLSLSRMFAVTVLAGLVLVPITAHAIYEPTPVSYEPSPISSAPLQVTQTTQVPGHQLKPGTYSIAILDRLADRMVIRITSGSNKEEATFIGLPGGNRLFRQGADGAISISARGGSKIALRGFTFPNGTVAEFVYPKDEAVALAKANNITVLAVDPSSEGRSTNPNMSRTDMELITLWMLTPTVVGKDSPAIEAKRYQDTTVADAQPVAVPTPAPAVQTTRTVAPVQVARATPPAPLSEPRAKPVSHPIATLPHTASNDPLILLMGLIALMFAGQMRFGSWSKRGR